LRTTVNGDQEAFFYDVRNFKYANWWNNDWNNGIVDWCFFGHDATGRLTEAENGTNGWNTNIISDVHRSYDAAGHLTQEQQIVTGLGTKTIQYPSYDNDGRLTRMYVSEASGYDFTYSYDTTGRFEKIFLTNSSQLFQYRYDAASNETERDNIPNGVNQFSPRDALNRMTTWDARKGTSTFSHEGYTYDSMNRIALVDWANTHTDSFNYYLDGELQQANLGNFGHNLTYNIDNMGNRTSVVDNNVTATYAPNSINEYTTGAGTSVDNGLEHEIRTYNSVGYAYINDERLKSATIPPAAPNPTIAYTLTYDALGRCMKRVLSGSSVNNGTPVTTYYIYDGEKTILEYDGSGASVGVNVYGKGIDEILERVATGADNQSHAYFLQQNHEGSVTLLTDISGNVIERYRYDAFGAPTIYDGNFGVRSNTIYDNRFLFTGREYASTYRSTYITPAFNFYEYRARAYNPTLGRFMSEDPKLFDAGDYNLFRYCHNDPVDLVDPMGTANMPYHLSPELLDYLYGKAMAAAQWIGSDLMHAQTASGAIGVGTGGYQFTGFLKAWAALKPGGTYGYKNIQRDRAEGKDPKDLREYNGTAERDGNGTFHITPPNKGNALGGVPPSAKSHDPLLRQGARQSGEPGYSSTIDIGPNTAGIYYSMVFAGDSIFAHEQDMAEAARMHHNQGGLALSAAPARGDTNGTGRPVFSGYDGSTGKKYGSDFFNQFPDFY
jgi:RHS repeat-associated protein